MLHAWMGRLVVLHPFGLGEEGGFKKSARGGLPLTTGENYSYQVRVGQLSRHSQVLLLPLGVPSMPVPACPTQSVSSISFACEWG